MVGISFASSSVIDLYMREWHSLLENGGQKRTGIMVD